MPKEETKAEQEAELDEEEANQEAMQPYEEGELTFCKHCQKQVVPYLKAGRWKCPTCHLYVKSKKSTRTRRRDEEETNIPDEWKFHNIKPVTLSGMDMAKAEVLINAGVANNFADLTRKALEVYYRSVNLPFTSNAMEINKPKEETMEDINRMKDKELIRRYKELEIKKMESDLNRANPQSEQKPTEDKLIENMEKQIRIKTMKKALEEKESGGLDIDSLIKWKLMDRMFSNNPEDSRVQAMQNQLQQLQQQLQQEKVSSQQQLQNERVIQRLEQMGSQKGLTAQDVLQFTSDKEAAIKLKDFEIQKERDARVEQRIKEIEKEIRQGGESLPIQRLTQFREELKAIKEMSHELGEREKSTGEYFSETIGNIAEKAIPPLTQLLEQKRQQQMQMQQPQIFPQPPQNPGLELKEIENPEEPEPLRADMTGTEKQISDQMSDMYIRKRKR